MLRQTLSFCRLTTFHLTSYKLEQKHRVKVFMERFFATTTFNQDQLLSQNFSTIYVETWAVEMSWIYVIDENTMCVFPVFLRDGVFGYIDKCMYNKNFRDIRSVVNKSVKVVALFVVFLCMFYESYKQKPYLCLEKI